MLKMEDSGIDSDTRSTSISGPQAANNTPRGLFSTADVNAHCSVKFSGEEDSIRATDESDWNLNESSHLQSESFSSPAARLITTSKLQKRLEKQILQAKKIRQREQTLSNEGVPKKLIPRNRLKVPKSNQVPVVTKADSHPLVSWESESEDEEFDFHPMSKMGTREITQQLIKDGFNVDLTPDDDDLDLIPPKPLEQKCACCNPANFCCIL